jgi:outer membrane receptor protein involved in Fe transport
MVSVRQSVATILGATRSASTTAESRTSRVFSSAGVLCALTVSATWSASALAQQAEPQGVQAPAAPVPATVTKLEEVTVTGTRIRRKDLESQSPLVTVDAEQLESRAGLNIESYLNNLPQYNPARTPTTENFDVQATPINTVGIATISLRGFGANRSLVLVDGHRTTPVNALMVTDINGIPASMIDQIQTISGGASAVYGADAIGGVTNFITKKNFQGAQIDVYDSLTQAGDGNEMRVSAVIGTKIGDNRGNLLMGVEYYNRSSALKRHRDFYTSSYNDPNASSPDFFTSGYAGWIALLTPPSVGAVNALWPQRGGVAGAPGTPACGFPGNCIYNSYNFNPNGSLWLNTVPAFGAGGPGPLSQSNYQGPTPGTQGYGLQNVLDGSQQNADGSPAPNIVQNLKWNNLADTISSPQTRYSFYANGNYNITDNVQFYTQARFANSQTSTLLGVVPSLISGWEASVPYNQATDDPILPGAITATTTQAQLSTIAAAFAANPTSNPYVNPAFKPIGTAGAQHPVPWQLAMLLDSRSILGAPALFGTPGAPSGLASFLFGPAATSTQYGGPVTCNNTIAASLCSPGSSSWQLQDLPYTSFGTPGRATTDTEQSFQIDAGFKFPLMIKDWTADVFYSRGQSTVYNIGYNDQSLERWRAVIDSPGYGMGQVFQGNQTTTGSQGFGTSVPTTCTSGFYNQIFGFDKPVSADCLNAVDATLQTETEMRQDIAEADLSGTLFKLPAGDISAAVGFQYRRDQGIFISDGLQSTNSFLDQTVGVYPSGNLNQAISSKDEYAELFVPVVRDLSILRQLNLDLGGRISNFDRGIPSSTTFKVDMDASITRSFRLRGGFNRANRAPNLGELYLNPQEFFGGGANFGDPCSVRSLAPFGAGGAAPDFSQTGSPTGSPTQVAGGQTAKGALSTYLICLAQMGGQAPTPTSGGTAAAAQYYGAQGNQAGAAVGGGFAWLNQLGNPNLRSETADTWTGGFVVSNLSDRAWLSGFSASFDWWRFNIQHAIELNSVDYSNYQCYGTATVTNATEALAQAQTPACLDVTRNTATGGGVTAQLTYTNQATIYASGMDIALNWAIQFQDIGLNLPGALQFSSQNTVLNYYKTKASPANFDINIDWKGSDGPTLANLDGGAYSFRSSTSISYIHPSFGVSLHWTYFPSVISAAAAVQKAEIQNNASAGPGGTILSYIPNTDFATPAWSVFDLSASWNINKTFQLRGGINNLFNIEPPIAGTALGAAKSAGYPPGTVLSAVCSAAALKLGCVNPTQYSLPNDGKGSTNAGFYAEGVYGRTFFLGVKASF